MVRGVLAVRVVKIVIGEACKACRLEGSDSAESEGVRSDSGEGVRV